MKFKLYILLFVLFFSKQVVAQNSYDLLKVNIDTVFVKSNKTTAPTEEVSIATKTSVISKEIISQAVVKSLADVLSENSMIYIRSYGDGAQATSSFRGTNSSHTAVTWNGIKINPIMSAGFDYSLFPAFFIDGASLSHGSTNLSGGSGALGGNVTLSNGIDNDTSPFNLFVEYGSYNTISSGISFVYGNSERTQFRTRLYYKQSDNDFKYLNKVYGIDQFYEYREDSAYKIGGAMQEIYTNFKNGATLSTNILAIFNDRELPQSILANNICHEQQDNSSIKIASTYALPTKTGQFTATAGYVFDTFNYEKSYVSHTTTDSDANNDANTFIVKATNFSELSSRFSLNSSLIYSHDIVYSDSYTDSRVDRDIVSAIVKGEFDVSGRFKVDATFMGELNNKNFAPTGSIGANYKLSNSLNIKASGGYNYRFPSLNDLYWSPSGNPDLKPEQGISTDMTLSYNSKITESLYLKAEASYYLMNIRDWIMWQPVNGSYIWQPQNILRVLSHGAELSTEVNYIFDSKWRAKAAASYTYSSSTSREKAFENDNSYKKQIQYVPKNKANLRIGVDYGAAYLTWQMYSVGKRYTTSDNLRYTDGYLMNDVEVGYNFKIKAKHTHRMPIRFKVNNLFNEYWESIEYYPMPLRSFNLNVGFFF
ncbi:MAG: TonB-dependent receptor [Rikenellaceae bacterium]